MSGTQTALASPPATVTVAIVSRMRRESSRARTTIAGSYKVAAIARPISIQAAYSIATEDAAAHSVVATIASSDPEVITTRGPCRPSIAATRRADSPDTRTPTEKAPLTAAMPQPDWPAMAGATTAKA